jgi:hypothetical protein
MMVVVVMMILIIMMVKEIFTFHSVALSSILVRESVVSRFIMHMVARIKVYIPAEKRNEPF